MKNDKQQCNLEPGQFALFRLGLIKYTGIEGDNNGEYQLLKDGRHGTKLLFIWIFPGLYVRPNKHTKFQNKKNALFKIGFESLNVLISNLFLRLFSRCVLKVRVGVIAIGDAERHYSITQ